MRYLAAILVLLLTGCAPLATFRLSPEVDLEVYRLEHSEAGFDVKVRFSETSDFEEVIQEGTLPTGETFVEKFTSSGGHTWTDYHYDRELLGFARGERKLVVYPGRSTGTDDTFLGFAMLPKNLSGSAVTNTNPKLFNARYCAAYRITGRVLAESQAKGWWALDWSKERLILRTPDGALQADRDGWRPVK